MARRKETIWQNDFSVGAPRPEAVERDDTALVDSAVREALNTIGLTTGQIEIRPGTVYENDTDAKRGIEVDLGAGRVFELHIIADGVVLYDTDGAVEYSNLLYDWTALDGAFGTYAFDDIKFWVVPDPDSSSILIGSKYFPIQALVLDGTWAMGAMLFSESLAGAVSQPYWRYYEGVTIAPSARTGAITVTASSSIWTAAHEGMAIRYVDREIILGTTVSGTVINAAVTEELPPTYTIVVASASGYQVGDAVEHSTLGGQGIITGISGTSITVLATSSYDGFNAVSSPKLVAPNAAQVISSVTAASPAASYLWETQMQSPIHGYAGYAARHKGRAYLCGFPGAPMAFAVSAAGSVTDFKMGANDGDGFVETLGADLGGSLLYIISAEDILFLTTKGLFYQQTRDGAAVTPTNIGPIRFSRIGCAEVEPVAVDDGCIFVDAVGQQVQAAVLSGDIYRSWRAQPLTKFHSHLISNPSYLGATSSGAETPEQFIFVVNDDGTAVVAQWDRDDNKVSWRPWSTTGSFQSIYQSFGKVRCVVSREIATVARMMRERFETGIVMDCVSAVAINAANPEGQAGITFAQGVTAFATHLDGEVATVYMERWDLGDNEINAFGKPIDGDGNVIVYPDYEGIAQVGLIFDMTIVPWSRRSAHTQRGDREIKRLIALMVTVQDSSAFTINGSEFGGYFAGEDLTAPPPLRNDQYKVTLVGESVNERIEIKKPRPGPFRILKIGYRVVI